MAVGIAPELRRFEMTRLTNTNAWQTRSATGAGLRPPRCHALNRRNVCCLQAFGTTFRFVADLLAFGERLEPFAANFGEVCEQVIPAVIWDNWLQVF
jgi:hypothetical protein